MAGNGRVPFFFPSRHPNFIKLTKNHPAHLLTFTNFIHILDASTIDTSTNFTEVILLPEGYALIKTVYLLLDDGDQHFLSQHDLTQVQFYALLWLADGPKNMRELSRDLLCDPSNITRVAAILERKGWITRVRDEKDRRAINLNLTPAGRQLCQEVQQQHEHYTLQRMRTLGEDEQHALLALLNKLGDGLRQQLQQQLSTSGAS